MIALHQHEPGRFSQNCCACQDEYNSATGDSPVPPPAEQRLHKDAGKPPIGLINRRALEEEAKVMAHGAKKYAPQRWREGIEWQRILDSIGRHWVAYNSGETIDAESGLSHMAHIRCDAAFLLEYEITHPELDNRYHDHGV